jgi:hypothetical protein
MAGFLSAAALDAVLADTAQRWASERAGAHPCGLAVWTYVHDLVGQIAPALPPHDSDEEAVAAVAAHGSLVKAVGHWLESVGCVRVRTARKGDIGIVNLPTVGLTAAVRLEDDWMMRGRRHLIRLKSDPVAVWRPSCLK